jgi:hypothetical protein
MKKNTFESYLVAIKAKYELEKTGEYSSYLSKPTPGSIKNLCSLLMDSNLSTSDQEIVNKFLSKDKFDNDRYKPICNFFKGKTETPKQSIVDFMALLVDLELRPLGKYLKNNRAIELEEIEKSENVNGVEKKLFKEEIAPSEREEVIKINTIKKNNDFFRKNKTKIIGSCAFASFSIFMISKTISKDSQCMEWQKNHYEVVDCESKSTSPVNYIKKIAKDENLLNFKKIEVCDSTTFFKHNKPIVWYYKNGSDVEFYNAPGFHPKNDKPLKPITAYMIDKYVK